MLVDHVARDVVPLMGLQEWGQFDVSHLLASLIILLSLYVAVFSIVFILSNAFSKRVRNFVLIFYGGLLGAFVGMLLPTISLIVLLVAVSIYDFVMLNSRWFTPLVHKFDSSKGAESRLSYVGSRIEIGVGEFIYYSFVPAHVEAYYGQNILILTLLMTALGVLINLRLLVKRGFVAGLLAPIILGLSPLTLHLLFESV